MADPLTDQEKMQLADAKERARAYVGTDDADLTRLINTAESREELERTLQVKTINAKAVVFQTEGLTPDEAVAIIPDYNPIATSDEGWEEGGVGGGAVTQRDAEVYTAKVDASDEVRRAVEAIIEGTDMTEDDLKEAFEAETVADAVNRAHVAAGSDVDRNRAIVDALGDEHAEASSKILFVGENATKEMLEAYGYSGKFSESHDSLITNGYSVKIDADDNIFYVDQSNQVMNIEGEHVGIFNRMTNVVDTLDHEPDPRAPIGMGSGTYIGEGSDVNQVAGRPVVSLKEWYGMYGDTFVDQVHNEGWEDILEAAGATQAYSTLTSRSEFGAELEELTTTTFTDLHYQYLAGDDVNQFIDMPTEDFAAWQARYADAGIYTVGKLGSFDPKFVAINEAVMTSANHNYEGDPDGMRKAWNDMAANPQLLDNWFGTRSSGGGSTSSRVWRPPAYLAPDYAELSQAVKLTFEDKLGRAPSDAEVELLSTKMKADHRSEFEAQSEAQELQFFSSGGVSAGTVQDVNYAARFQEDFEGKYSDELGTLDRIEMSRNMTQQALGSILSADRAIGY